MLSACVGKSVEVGLLGFHFIPQTSAENVVWTEVRWELGTHMFLFEGS